MYLVIKVNGTGYSLYELKNMIKDRFQGLEFVEDKNVQYLKCEKKIDIFELLTIPECKQIVKREIARDLAEYLLDNDLISFTEQDNEHIKTIKGKITVIKEG